MEMELARRTKLRTLIELLRPTFPSPMSLSRAITLLTTESVEPMRTRWRTDIEEPKVEQSSTERPEENLTKPNAEMVELRRTWPRRDTALPRCKKSSTEQEEPSRDSPYTEQEEEKRAENTTRPFGISLCIIIIKTVIITRTAAIVKIRWICVND